MPAPSQHAPIGGYPQGVLLGWRREKGFSSAYTSLTAWTLFVTNVPRNRLTLSEALVLGRTRWQIELLFRLWKSHGRFDESRSTKPWRILCEVTCTIHKIIWYSVG